MARRHEGPGERVRARSVNAEHPLFILYTSGSTGKPKGVQHSTGGYLLWAAMTMKWVFDIKPTDVFWCTADVGWVTGHTLRLLRPARRRRDRSDLRRRSRLIPDAGRSGRCARTTSVTDLLHRADGDPLADQGGQRSAGEVRPVEIARARHGWRADQSRSMDVVLHRGGSDALPGGRHVLADRNRWPHDHATAGRDAAGAGFVHAAAAGDHGRHRRRDRARRTERSGRPAGRQASVAVDDPHHLGRPGAFQEVVLPGRSRRQALSGGRRLGARQGDRLLHHHGPHRRRAERLRPPDGHDGDRVRPRRESDGGGSRGRGSPRRLDR